MVMQAKAPFRGGGNRGHDLTIKGKNDNYALVLNTNRIK